MHLGDRPSSRPALAPRRRRRRIGRSRRWRPASARGPVPRAPRSRSRCRPIRGVGRPSWPGRSSRVVMRPDEDEHRWGRRPRLGADDVVPGDARDGEVMELDARCSRAPRTAGATRWRPLRFARLCCGVWERSASALTESCRRVLIHLPDQGRVSPDRVPRPRRPTVRDQGRTRPLGCAGRRRLSGGWYVGSAGFGNLRGSFGRRKTAGRGSGPGPRRETTVHSKGSVRGRETRP